MLYHSIKRGICTADASLYAFIRSTRIWYLQTFAVKYLMGRKSTYPGAFKSNSASAYLIRHGIEVRIIGIESGENVGDGLVFFLGDIPNPLIDVHRHAVLQGKRGVQLSTMHLEHMTIRFWSV